MASVGTKLTIPFTVGAGAIVGQGNAPELWAVVAFDDSSDPTPNWVDLTSKVRHFEVHRAEGQAGTADLIVDNRTRAYDPTFASSPYYPNVRPNNRVWLFEQFTGETNSLFKGYVNSWNQQWPSGGWSDAVVAVSCTDEYKILTLSTLPTTNPPRLSYQELVASDNPSGQWSMDEDSASRVQPPAIASLGSAPIDKGFELGDLGGKLPSRKHAKKPKGKGRASAGPGPRHTPKPIKRRH